MNEEKPKELTPEEILQVNIDTGVPLVYEIDASGKVLSKQILAREDS